jgi:hypothetical protein
MALHPLPEPEDDGQLPLPAQPIMLHDVRTSSTSQIVQRPMPNGHLRDAGVLSHHGHGAVAERQMLPDTRAPVPVMVDQSIVAEIARRLEHLESYLLRIEREIEAQSDVIGALETERTALRVRIAALESRLLDTVGAVITSVVQHVAVIVVLACSLATFAAFILRWWGVTIPLTEPIVITAFAIGALSGAFAMAIHLLR